MVNNMYTKFKFLHVAQSPTSSPMKDRSASAGLHTACRTGLAIRAGCRLRGLAIGDTLEEVADALDTEQARVLDGRGVCYH